MQLVPHRGKFSNTMKRAIQKSKRRGKRPAAGRPATGNDLMMSLRMPKELTAAVERGLFTSRTSRPDPRPSAAI
jgi:hypothetical protein